MLLEIAMTMHIIHYAPAIFLLEEMKDGPSRPLSSLLCRSRRFEVHLAQGARASRVAKYLPGSQRRIDEAEHAA